MPVPVDMDLLPPVFAADYNSEGCRGKTPPIARRRVNRDSSTTVLHLAGFAAGIWRGLASSPIASIEISVGACSSYSINQSKIAPIMPSSRCFDQLGKRSRIKCSAVVRACSLKTALCHFGPRTLNLLRTLVRRLVVGFGLSASKISWHKSRNRLTRSSIENS